MLKIGITGGIGSGKTLISKILIGMGYPVFNSDVEAKNILHNDPEVRVAIQTEFGEKVFYNGVLQNSKLSELVFKDVEKLKKLNSIIHPRVKIKFEDWISNQQSSLVFKEAALLVSSGSYKELDFLIVVDAPEKVRVQRVMERDNISEQQVLARIKNQSSSTALRAHAHFIIENDNHHALLPQIDAILKEIKK